MYRENEETLGYSTSNRRLRSLEEGGYVERRTEAIGPGGPGRRRIHYTLSFKGSLAALVLQPPPSEEEFVALVRNCSAVNNAYGLFDRLMSLGVPVKSIWESFGGQLKGAIEKGRVNLDAADETLEVFIGFELIKSIGRPTKELPEKRKEIVEAVYDFVGSCPFEGFFGNMTVVMLGAIAQRYLKTSKAFRRIYTRVEGDIRFTFNPLSDGDAIKVLPFLDPTYSRIANETSRIFSELSSFVYTMYDEYGEM